MPTRAAKAAHIMLRAHALAQGCSRASELAGSEAVQVLKEMLQEVSAGVRVLRVSVQFSF